jgi:hypothetical protein
MGDMQQQSTVAIHSYNISTTDLSKSQQTTADFSKLHQRPLHSMQSQQQRQHLAQGWWVTCSNITSSCNAVKTNNN